MAQQRHRTARTEARIAPDALAIVRRAAEIQGRSVSDVLVAAAQEAASRTIAETEIIRLSVEDQRRVAQAILDPPEPTPGLRRPFSGIVSCLARNDLVRFRLGASRRSARAFRISMR
jgi:uncharacterized protein (DUF1778 family)